MTGQPRVTSLRKAVAVVTAADAFSRAATVALTVLTARTLEPAEIGTLGLVVAVIAIISMLGGYVEAGALISTDGADDALRAGIAGGMRLIVVSAPLFLVLRFQEWLVDPFLTDPARRAQAHALIPVLALLPVIEALAGVPIVFLQRRLLLAPVTARQIWQPAVYSVGGGLMVLLGFGTLGLAWAQIAGATATAASLWLVGIQSGLAPGRIDFKVARAIFRESVRQGAAGFVGFMSERVDNLLVAGSLGPAALSFYSFAWNASRLPVFIVSRVSRSAFLPALVRARGRLDDGRRILLLGLEAAMGLSVGIGLLVALFGAEAVTMVVGTRWAVAGDCLETMALTVAVSPLLFLPFAALQASGEAHKGGLAAASLQMAVQFALIPPMCAGFGERGAAIVDFVAFSAATMVVARWTRRFGSPSSREILTMLKAPLCGVACAATVMILVGWTKPTSLLWMVKGVVASSVLYVGGYVVLGKGRLSLRS